MLRAFIFLLCPLLSVGLVMMFGFAALIACFGLALLTLVFSTQGVPEEEIALPAGTQPAGLAP
jgi:hypothetical protein